MAAVPYDSAAWRALFHDPELAVLFTDTAVLRAQMLVLGARALAQAKAGVMPQGTADAIQRAAMEVQIDPAAVIADADGLVAGLIAIFRAEIGDRDMAPWIGHKCQPADVAVTAFALRLRQVLALFERRLRALDVVPHQALDLLPGLRRTVLVVHEADADTRAGLAKGLALDLPDPLITDRPVAALARWMNLTAGLLPATDDQILAVQGHIRALNVALSQKGSLRSQAMMAELCLPQMSLGLGQMLLAAAGGVAN